MIGGGGSTLTYLSVKTISLIFFVLLVPTLGDSRKVTALSFAPFRRSSRRKQTDGGASATRGAARSPSHPWPPSHVAQPFQNWSNSVTHQ